MSKNFITLIFFSIIFGVLSCFIWETAFKPAEPKHDAKTVVDTFWRADSIKPKPYKPKSPIVVVDTFWKTQPVDTNAILQEHYNKHVNIDTLVNDSALFVSITDTVCQNKIISRQPLIIRNYPIIINTITQYKSANGVYIGAYAGMSFGGEVSYLNNNNIFGLGAGTNGVYIKYSRKLK